MQGYPISKIGYPMDWFIGIKIDTRTLINEMEKKIRIDNISPINILLIIVFN